jgi:plasmid stabilization system protein ParE
MPNLRFEYHPEAVDEAIEAYNWYADRDERAADGFLEELRRARQTVSEQPEAGRRTFTAHAFFSSSDIPLAWCTSNAASELSASPLRI